MKKSRYNRLKIHKMSFNSVKRRLVKEILYFLLCGLIFYGLVQASIPPVQRTMDTIQFKYDRVVAAIRDDIKSPLVEKANAQTKQIVELSPTPIPMPIHVTPSNEEIVSYIKEVFGDNSIEAFQLLSCENSSLNPDIVNTAGNEPAGSRDIGVFQINEYWQSVRGKFLFNWKINVQIAHQIYTEDDNSFKMWTCGRKLGI